VPDERVRHRAYTVQTGDSAMRGADAARRAAHGGRLLQRPLRARLLADGDLVLAVPVESPTMFLSFTPVVSTLEALAAYIARVDPDRTYETLVATGEFVDRQRLMLEPGPPTGQGAPE
jgi:hypothetical protein